MQAPLDSVLFRTGPIEAVQQFFGLGHAPLFTVIGLPGDVWGMVMVLGIGRWLWGRELAYLLLGAVIVGTLTKQVMTMGFGLPRPEGPDIVVYHDIDLGSFPSGHVYVATVAWGMFWALGLMPLWLPLTITVTVAVSRIYLGVHYLIDVVGGIVLAVPLIFTWRWLWPRLRPRLARLPEGFWICGGAMAVGGTVLALYISPDNPRRWEIVGFAAGTVLGMFADRRWLRPAGVRRSLRTPAVVIGFLGILAIVGVNGMAGDHPLWTGAALAALASIWALFLSPLALQALSHADEARSS